MLEMTKTWKNKQHPFKTKWTTALFFFKWYPSIHFPGHRPDVFLPCHVSSSSSGIPKAICYTCSVLRICPRVSFEFDMSRIPLQESVWQASWSDVEPAQLAQCEDCQPRTNLPVNLPLHIVFTYKHNSEILKQKLIPKLKKTINCSPAQYQNFRIDSDFLTSITNWLLLR